MIAAAPSGGPVLWIVVSWLAIVALIIGTVYLTDRKGD